MIGLRRGRNVHQACSWILITFLIIDGSFVPRATSNFLYYRARRRGFISLGRGALNLSIFQPCFRVVFSRSARVLASHLVVRIKSWHRVPDEEGEGEGEEAGQRELRSGNDKHLTCRNAGLRAVWEDRRVCLKFKAMRAPARLSAHSKKDLSA